MEGGANARQACTRYGGRVRWQWGKRGDESVLRRGCSRGSDLSEAEVNTKNLGVEYSLNLCNGTLYHQLKWPASLIYIERHHCRLPHPELWRCSNLRKKKKFRKWSSAKVGIASLHHLRCFLFLAVAPPTLHRLPSVGWPLWSRLHIFANFRLLSRKELGKAGGLDQPICTPSISTFAFSLMPWVNFSASAAAICASS